MTPREQYLFDFLKSVIQEASLEETKRGIALTSYVTKPVADALAHTYRQNGASVAFSWDSEGNSIIIIDTEEISIHGLEIYREFYT